MVNTLTVMKYDLNCCVSGYQLMNAKINALLTNVNKSSFSSPDTYDEYDLNDIFPIESHEALQEFELKLQKNENNFKSIMVKIIICIIIKVYFR